MFTPLHSAAQQGHVMIVKQLLEHGASPNKTNKVRRSFFVVGSITISIDIF
jgi:ankyrin repeat protein